MQKFLHKKFSKIEKIVVFFGFHFSRNFSFIRFETPELFILVFETWVRYMAFGRSFVHRWWNLGHAYKNFWHKSFSKPLKINFLRKSHVPQVPGSVKIFQTNQAPRYREKLAISRKSQSTGISFCSSKVLNVPRYYKTFSQKPGTASASTFRENFPHKPNRWGPGQNYPCPHYFFSQKIQIFCMCL